MNERSTAFCRSHRLMVSRNYELKLFQVMCDAKAIESNEGAERSGPEVGRGSDVGV